MRNKLSKFLATFFYIGDLPFAPGSIASIAGTLIYIIVYQNLVLYLFCLTAITAIGFLVSGRAEKIVGQKDPTCIVIDEVAGMLIAFFMLPISFSVLITTFFLFRAFDMFKIYPAYKLEKYPGSVGVMMDDLIAGVYANLVMHSAIYLINKF